MASYIALLRKETRSDYGVSFPDFPGCISAGSSLDEARRRADEALNAHVALMIEDGDEIPAASTLDQVMADAESRNATAFLVDVKPPEDKAVRVNITMPAHALEEIDKRAAEAGESRSSYLVRAALAQPVRRRNASRSSASVRMANKVESASGRYTVRRSGQKPKRKAA